MQIFCIIALYSPIRNFNKIGSPSNGRVLVDSKEVRQFAKENGGLYMESSLNNDHFIIQALEQLTRAIIISRK
ncbi:MAG: hypothetical protein ACFFAS_06985 [Promethearchaeota archaeon]